MSSVLHTKVKRYENKKLLDTEDLVAVEEPLEIRLGYGKEGERSQERLAVTMRTPGHDFELGLGMLFSEGIIDHFGQVSSLHYCETVKEDEKENVIRIELSEDVKVNWELIHRHIYSHSACGVCGKTSIEAVLQACPVVENPSFELSLSLISGLPAKLRSDQLVFNYTGGLHAVGLFDPSGKLMAIREDVGRHNALDKLIGHYFQKEQLPLNNCILVLSGRISYELVQKAARAAIPVICAVGAPSSLAVKLAEETGITLIGFLKEDYFNVYSGGNLIKE